jgi:predicted ATP-binding protein involved in virulence
MKLKSVTLENFKCFEKLTVDLHPRLTVFVGTNGAGKTAILDAIAIGLSPVLTYLSSANQRLSGRSFKDTDFRLTTWTRKGQPKTEAADYARVAVETTDGLTWDQAKSSIKGKKPPEQIGQASLAKAMAEIMSSARAESPLLLPVLAYYGAQRGAVDIPGRLRKARVDHSQRYSALVGALDAVSNFRDVMAWFDQAEAAELRANKGSLAQDYEPTPELEAVRAAIKELLGGKFEDPHINATRKFVVRDAQSKKELQVAQLSQGYQSMLALSMDFAARLATANDHLDYEGFDSSAAWFKPVSDALSSSDSKLPDSASFVAPAIMLIDEIDVHLHPGWQQTVLSDLLMTFPNTQFIVTTHSPQVISSVDDECVRILDDGQLSSAPPGTAGAEASRVLTRVFFVDQRPKDLPAAMELKRYMDLVYANQWASEEALALRQKLDARYKGEEPALLETDLYIDNRKWESAE